MAPLIARSLTVPLTASAPMLTARKEQRPDDEAVGGIRDARAGQLNTAESASAARRC